VRGCSTPSCESLDPNACIDCQWSEWSDLGPCTCLGLREKRRHIEKHSNYCGKPCNGPKTINESCVPDCKDFAVSITYHHNEQEWIGILILGIELIRLNTVKRRN
jgi:hypothetical protein